MAFHRNVHRWLGGYLRHVVHRRSKRVPPPGKVHVLFALCDHYEPLWGDANERRGHERVAAWLEGYGAALGEFRDADGYAPRHSFFFPGEQYRPGYLDALGKLAASGYGEVEVHLHHDGDDAARLEQDLGSYVATYAEHGHLTRGERGEPRYAF